MFKKAVAGILSLFFVLGILLPCGVQPVYANETIIEYDKNPYTDDVKYTYTDWEYYHTMDGDTRAQKWTVGSIGIIIANYLPWAPAKIVTQMASLYYGLNTDNVYTTTITHKKWVKVDTPLKPLAGEKTVVKFYSDKKRTKLIDTITHIGYTKWYKA